MGGRGQLRLLFSTTRREGLATLRGWTLGLDRSWLVLGLERAFRLGNLLTDSYEATMLSDRLLGPLEDSMTTSVPMCDECAFEPYCGADPVFHHAVYGELESHYLGGGASLPH